MRGTKNGPYSARSAAWLGAVVGTLIGASGAFATPLTAGRSAATMTAEQRFAMREAKRQASQKVDPHGAATSIEVAPIVDSLASNAGKASGVFHLEVDNLEAAEILIAYEWTLVDEQGQVLGSATGGNVGKVLPKQFYASEGWHLPELAEGLYRATVIVASGSKERPDIETVTMVDWWLEVVDGQFVELSSAEWLDKAPSASSAVEVFP